MLFIFHIRSFEYPVDKLYLDFLKNKYLFYLRIAMWDPAMWRMLYSFLILVLKYSAIPRSPVDVFWSNKGISDKHVTEEWYRPDFSANITIKRCRMTEKKNMNNIARYDVFVAFGEDCR